jgi:HK97 family phage prohead protease
VTEVLFRSAAPEDVRFDLREIDVLAVPYNTPTAVMDYSGAEYLETIAPGAFAEVGLRARRIKVLRDHRPERAIGKCISLDADQSDGLRATLRITPGIPLGDETLRLAADGVLDVSIGFSARSERWNHDRSAVTRTSCWLHELSLVPMPAYDTATVLAVRQQTAPVAVAVSATPNFDEIRDLMSAMKYRQHPIESTRDEASPPLKTA